MNGKLHRLFRLRAHQGVVTDSLEVADVARVAIIILLFRLAAGENGIRAVDDDDMITAVDMRGKGGLVLAAEKNRGLRCNAAERLPPRKCLEYALYLTIRKDTKPSDKTRRFRLGAP